MLFVRDEKISRDRPRRLRLRKMSLGAGLVSVALAWSPLGCISRPDDGGDDGNETGGTGPSTGASSGTGGKPGATGGSGTGGARVGSGGSGGQGIGGSSAGGGGDPSGGTAGEPGAGGLGGQGAICEIPFDGGDCDAAIRVYSHNPQSDLCEPAVYGGCGGNENRFDSLQECEKACGANPPGVSCEVDGIIYPHGSSGVPDLRSCNTCGCDNGELTGCSEDDCPTPCPDGSLSASECVACGPADECLTVRHTCLPACGPADECPGGGWCNSGICRRSYCV